MASYRYITGKFFKFPQSTISIHNSRSKSYLPKKKLTWGNSALILRQCCQIQIETGKHGYFYVKVDNWNRHLYSSNIICFFFKYLNYKFTPYLITVAAIWTKQRFQRIFFSPRNIWAVLSSKNLGHYGKLCFHAARCVIQKVFINI